MNPFAVSGKRSAGLALDRHPDSGIAGSSDRQSSSTSCLADHAGRLPQTFPNVPLTAGAPRINHRVNTDPEAENIRERLRLMYYTE